jgi:signal transduction histidine kinase
MNYAPKVTEGYYLKEWVGMSYFIQYSTISLLGIITGNAVIVIFLGDLRNNKYRNIKNIEQLKKFRNRMLEAPWKIYLFQTFSPVFLIVVFHRILSVPVYVTFKTVLILLVFTLSIEIISTLSARKYIKSILSETFLEGEKLIWKYGLNFKIFFQIIPMFIVIISITSLVGYSRFFKERGDFAYEHISHLLKDAYSNANIQNINDIETIFKTIQTDKISELSLFAIDRMNKYINFSGKKEDKYFLNYLYEITKKEGRVYQFLDEKYQGATIKKDGYVIGIKYKITNNEDIYIFMFNFLILIVISFVILLVFSKSISNDITQVAQELEIISTAETVNGLQNVIKITSKDEIGDLIHAFSKIQNKFKTYLNDIEEKNQVLIQKDRLAALGQLIGGIAHSLKTPLSTISDTTTCLSRLIGEYKESVNVDSVTSEDHLEIAREMETNIEEMKEIYRYMNTIISTVKNQSADITAHMQDVFTLRQLLDMVEILMKSEIKTSGCKHEIVKKDIREDEKIEGDARNLIQVLNVLISNAIYACKGIENPLIITEFSKVKENIVINVIDNGKGIEREVQDKLFSKMITTKGTNGTGIGLFISNSIIKGKFNGNLNFSSILGKGTTFTIEIPVRHKVDTI